MSEKKIYTCDTCSYNTAFKTHYLRHLESAKHHKTELTIPSNQLSCLYCGMVYKSRAGLWKHVKLCKIISNDGKSNGDLDNEDEMKQPITDFFSKEMLMEMFKQNTELKNIILEQNKIIVEQSKSIAQNGSQTNTMNNSHNHTNSHNKTFNLQFFLNEQCKDAMTLCDFMNSLKIGVKDLEHTGEVGFVNGISDIFIKGLSELDVYKRPIHCSDVKRETIYIKQPDGWEKDNNGNPIMRNSVKYIINKNFGNLAQWQDENPSYKDIETSIHTKYMTIIEECFPGTTDEECNKNINRVIQNIAKRAIIDKK
jgi:hypothetical protein